MGGWLAGDCLAFCPFHPEAESDNRYWDCGVIVIVITMFQIQRHQKAGCLSGGERRQGHRVEFC